MSFALDERMPGSSTINLAECEDTIEQLEFSSAEDIRIKKRPVRKCRLLQQPLNIRTSLKRLYAIDNNPIIVQFNEAFCQELKHVQLPSAEAAILIDIEKEIEVLHCQFYGWPTMPDNDVTNAAISTGQEDETEASTWANINLIPQSEWIYKTPIKQCSRAIKEVQFEMPSNYTPAVIQQIQETEREGVSWQKILYVLNEDISPPINILLTHSGQIMPIDLNYMQPESSINSYINVLPSIQLPNHQMTFSWFQPMKMLTANKPQKTPGKRRNLLEKRSRSFDSQRVGGKLKFRSRCASFHFDYLQLDKDNIEQPRKIPKLKL